MLMQFAGSRKRQFRGPVVRANGALSVPRRSQPKL